MLTAVIVVLALVALVVIVLKAGPPSLTIDPHQRMQLWKAILLLLYLTLFALLAAYVGYALWSAEPSLPPDKAGQPVCSSGQGAPFVASLYPDRVFVSMLPADIQVRGCSFAAADKVKVNGVVARTYHFDDGKHMRVLLNPEDAGMAAAMLISVSRDSTDSAPVPLRVIGASVLWSLFPWGPWIISQEVQFLLLVLALGALGSSVYALKSMADYIGQAKLCEPWFTFYLIQPLEGAGVALILYLVIRGGFLGGLSVDLKNQTGICATAALAGAFSDIAFMKLREVFESLFKPKDDRGGKIVTLKITNTTLPDATVSHQYAPQTLQVANGTAPFVWTVTPNLPPGLQLNANTGVISGTPTEVRAAADFAFKVTDAENNSGTAVLRFTVVAPA